DLGRDRPARAALLVLTVPRDPLLERSPFQQDVLPVPRRVHRVAPSLAATVGLRNRPRCAPSLSAPTLSPSASGLRQGWNHGLASKAFSWGHGWAWRPRAGGLPVFVGLGTRGGGLVAVLASRAVFTSIRSTPAHCQKPFASDTRSLSVESPLR